MNSVKLVDPSVARGRAKELLDDVKSKFGMVPNIAKAMANAPSVLAAYLAMNDRLSTCSLHKKTREQIALLVAQRNRCDYCLSAHCAIGKIVGLSSEELISSRQGTSRDSRTNAVLQIAGAIVENRGQIGSMEMAAARQAGLDGEAILLIVAEVSLNTFTNYFNHVAGALPSKTNEVPSTCPAHSEPEHWPQEHVQSMLATATLQSRHDDSPQTGLAFESKVRRTTVPIPTNSTMEATFARDLRTAIIN